MRADVEWVVGVVRAGSQFKKYGDPYEFSCTVIRRGEVAEIVGASGRFDRSIYESVRAALLAEGITEAIWERKNSGGTRSRRAR